MRIVNCARCGGDHDVVTLKLDRPFAPPEAAPVVWQKWALCPTNGQPILIAETPDADPRTPSVHGTHQFNEALEVAYWIFDSKRAGTSAARVEAGLGPQSERDAFKDVFRDLYGKWKPSTFEDVLVDAKAALLKIDELHDDPSASAAEHAWSKAKMFVQNIIDTCERRLRS